MNEENKHVIYAEDILYAIMQYPGKSITKGIVKQIVEQVVKEKEIQIGNFMPIA